MDDHDFIRVDIEHTPETCPACRLKTLRVAIQRWKDGPNLCQCSLCSGLRDALRTETGGE
jgi:hypothetical protein